MKLEEMAELDKIYNKLFAGFVVSFLAIQICLDHLSLGELASAFISLAVMVTALGFLIICAISIKDIKVNK